MQNPFKLEILDKDFKYQVDIGDPLRLTFTPRHNQQPTGELVMRARHHAVPTLAALGARYRLYYKGDFMSSGTVDMRAAEGPQGEATVTYQLRDDFAVINNTLGWQRPSGTVNNQTAAEYKTYTGAAETIVLTALEDNAVDRLGLPLILPTTQGRGGTVSGGVKFRMDILGELLLPMLDATGLGVRFRNYGQSEKITVEVYEPVTQPLGLSEAGGQVLSYSWTARNPSVTRVVAGGANEKKKRFFDGYTSTLMEGEYGIIVEGFADAADLGEDLRSAQSEHERTYDDKKQKRKDKDAAYAEYRSASRKKDSMYAVRKLASHRGGTAYDDAKYDYTSAVSEYNTARSAYITARDAYDAAVIANNNAISAESTAGVNHHTELIARAKEKVAEGHPTFGFDLTLGESDNFTYGGDGVHVGDRITVDAGGLVITDVLRSCTLSYSTEGGLTVTPVVGDNEDENPDRALGKLMGKAFKAIQKLRTSR